jgi:hypothetical protein
MPQRHGQQQQDDSGLSSGKLAGIAIIIVFFIVLIGVFPIPSSVQWVLIAILMIAFVAVIGRTISGRWTGILIDERKVMSLSRFQIVIWTVIIVSAYFAIASARIYAGVPDPLAIEIDWRLWALLGISSTSLVGTPLILDSKKRKVIDKDKEAKNLKGIASRLKTKESNPENATRENASHSNPQEPTSGNTEDSKSLYGAKDNVEGIVFVNKEVEEAKFSDIFEGDEAGNESRVDVSKVQMFFFTIISALSYGVLLFNMLATTNIREIESLPPLSEGLIALLTISHGTYLTNKTIDHTATERI